jgi:hypothetical protein
MAFALKPFFDLLSSLLAGRLFLLVRIRLRNLRIDFRIERTKTFNLCVAEQAGCIYRSGGVCDGGGKSRIMWLHVPNLF